MSSGVAQRAWKQVFERPTNRPQNGQTYRYVWHLIRVLAIIDAYVYKAGLNSDRTHERTHQVRKWLIMDAITHTIIRDTRHIRYFRLMRLCCELSPRMCCLCI